MNRRATLSRRAFLVASSIAGQSLALARTPQVGVLRMVVPFRLNRLDPHALHDPIAALFGAAIADPLFALDDRGRAYPALAAALPEAIPGGARVRLRPGLLSARGARLTNRDVAASIERARRGAAAALAPDLGPAVPETKDANSVQFRGADPARLAEALANPLFAILPRAFSPLAPDGTGAFAAQFEAGALRLVRNVNAARGPSFLERIDVGTTTDLADALRAFEAGSVDIGWLGSGLYRPRRGALTFRGAHYGWAILRHGKQLGAWGAPGVAQQLLDSIDPARLRHLGLEGLLPARGANVTWAGGATEIDVLEDAPQLVLIARTLAEVLSTSGHELRVAPRSYADIERKRASRDFGMMVDFVRTLGPKGPLTQVALMAAQSPELAKRPPRANSFDARAIAASLTLGVVGELWVAGSHTPAERGLTGWVLGNAWKVPDAELSK